MEYTIFHFYIYVIFLQIYYQVPASSIELRSFFTVFANTPSFHPGFVAIPRRCTLSRINRSKVIDHF